MVVFICQAVEDSVPVILVNDLQPTVTEIKSSAQFLVFGNVH